MIDHRPTSLLSPSDARRIGKRARAALSAIERARYSRLICARIAKHPWFIRARIVALYRCSATETDLDDLLHIALQSNKVILVPKIERGNRMRFHRVTERTQWAINAYDLREPVVSSRYANRYWQGQAIDLVCAPLTAFDAQFNRVGMGGGYYDRYFAAAAKQRFTRLMGVGFHTQCTTTIATNKWDVAMHAIATERRIMTRTTPQHT